MKYLFLMDPLDLVMMEKDTSFILMWEAHRRGHEVFFVADGAMSATPDGMRFHALAVEPQLDREQPFVRKDSLVLSEKDVDAVFIRNDPPFDGQYLMNTWLLELLPPRIPVINRPGGIRAVNEKIWVNRFRDLIPPTLITRDPALFREFLREHGEIVVKPSNGFGGQSVFHLKAGDTNANVTFETLTGNGARDVIVQRFIPESRQGDKRILLLNGEFLGAVLRVHGADDHRNNFFAGGRPQATTLTDRERDIIEVLKPFLKQLGLYFVGIDVMGDYLIEVNVTSPTCLQEINTLEKKHLERNVMDFVEELITITTTEARLHSHS